MLYSFRRKEKNITEMVTEMFTCGVSTKEVKPITRLLWGKELRRAEFAVSIRPLAPKWWLGSNGSLYPKIAIGCGEKD